MDHPQKLMPIHADPRLLDTCDDDHINICNAIISRGQEHARRASGVHIDDERGIIDLGRRDNSDAQMLENSIIMQLIPHVVRSMVAPDMENPSFSIDRRPQVKYYERIHDRRDADGRSIRTVHFREEEVAQRDIFQSMGDAFVKARIENSKICRSLWNQRPLTVFCAPSQIS